MTSLPSLRVPVIAAPMAGGPSSPELVVAVAEAGGMGFLAAGYKKPEAVAAQFAAVRHSGATLFGVNLFAPTVVDRDRHEVEVDDFIAHLQPLADELSITLPEPRWDDTDDYDAKIDLLEQQQVPVVSFTFGLPTSQVVDRLHAAGTCVVVTVTDPDEALASARVGADALCLQGEQAGGHRSTHQVADIPNDRTWQEMYREVESVARLPIIVAGGVMSEADTRLAVGLGAAAVSCGTAFLLTPEAGTNAAVRAALTAEHTSTRVTRAFSGRPARGIRNRFITTYGDLAPACYPIVDQLTKPIRAAGAKNEDPQLVAAWAGTGWRYAQAVPAGEVVAHLAP